MTRYIIDYVTRRRCIIEAESESAARQAFIDLDVDVDWEIDSGPPTEITSIQETT